MRNLLSGLVSILFISQQAFAFTDAPTPEGVVVSPQSVKVFDPTEASGVGLEDVPPKIKAIVAKIAALPAQANAQGALMVVPELAELQKGEVAYASNRPTCFADQARASMICREETSPNLQTTLQGVNLAISGINSLAVNDACKGFSKAMSLAQAGVTAYTVACGLLQKKCNMSCASTTAGMKLMIQGLVASKATCTPTPPRIDACVAPMGQLVEYKLELKAEIEKEAQVANKLSLHAKEKLCQHDYKLLLVSAGASILSLANSAKQGSQCDEESDATGAGSTASSPTTSTDVTSGTTPFSKGIENSSTEGTGTLIGAEISQPSTSDTTVASGSGSSATQDPNSGVGSAAFGTSEVGTPMTRRSGVSAGGSSSGSAASGSSELAQGRSVAAESTAGSSDSGELAGGGASGRGGFSAGGSSSGETASESAYREYLPGGEKDPNRSVAGQEAWRKEVTGAGGKSNWAKMQDRYKTIKTLNDD